MPVEGLFLTPQYTHIVLFCKLNLKSQLHFHYFFISIQLAQEEAEQD